MADQAFKLTNPAWKAPVEDYVTSLAWSTDGGTLAVGCGEGDLIQLETRKGDRLRSVSAHGMGLLSLSWSPRAGLLASGGQEKNARLWDPATLEPKAALTAGQASSVDVVSWCPTAPLLATVCGKQVNLWSADGTQIAALAPHAFTVSAIAWSADGKRLATAAFDALRVWDVATGALLKNYETGTSILSLAWKPNDEVIVGGTQDATMLIWSLNEAEAFQAGPFEVKVKELAFHYSGTHLVSGGGSDITLWDFSKGSMQGSRPVFLAAHQDLVTTLAFQKVGPLCASGGRDGAVYFWRPAANAMPLLYAHFGEEITAMAWHPRDGGVAIGTADGTVSFIEAPGRR